MIKYFNVNMNTGYVESICTVNMKCFYFTDVNMF